MAVFANSLRPERLGGEQNAMTKREPPQAGTVDLAAPVTTDAPCRKCGYNLRGLSTSLRCPECNTPVLLSIHGDYLGFSDPRWLRSLRRGINLIIGAVALIIGAFVMTLVVKFLAPQQGLESIVFAAALLTGCLMILIGNWLITSPDPSGLGEDEYGMERKVARIGITVWMCGAVVSVASLMGALPAAVKPVIDILSICLVLIALVAFCAQIHYLGKLAMRIPSAAVADRASFLKSAFAISYGLLFVIWVLMRLMGAAPQRNPEMMAVSCGAGMLGLLWGLMYLLMLEKLGRLLHPLALAAEQIWWAANETAESK